MLAGISLGRPEFRAKRSRNFHRAGVITIIVIIASRKRRVGEKPHLGTHTQAVFLFMFCAVIVICTKLINEKEKKKEMIITITIMIIITP